MKKLMVMLAGLALAGAVQAATTDWKVTGLDASYNGWTAYFFRGNGGNVRSFDSEEPGYKFNYYILNMGLGKYSSWKDYYAYFSSQLAGNLATISDGEATVTMENGPYTKSSAMWVLFEDGVSAGSDYIIMKTAYSENTESSNTLVFDLSDVGILATGTLRTDAVPEPTSGLLLLVGGALVALKRKQNR